MKILAIGDLHGKIPHFVEKAIWKEKPDLIVSVGDFCAFYERKLFFKHSYLSKEPLEKFIGKKKAREFARRDINSGLGIINFLKKFKIPVIAVSGNADPTKYDEIYNKKIAKTHDSDTFDKYYSKNLVKNTENFKIIDFQAVKFQDFVFIGSHKSSYPGYLPKPKWKKNRKPYLKYKKKLEKLFNKHKGQKIIFLSHNVPYFVLDKIREKTAHKKAKGKHYGSYLTREMIKKYQPLICLAGHIHENRGMKKLGKTKVYNLGFNKYTIINI